MYYMDRKEDNCGTLKCEARTSQVWNTSHMAWEGLMLMKLQLHKTRPSSKASRSSVSKGIHGALQNPKVH